MTIERIDMAIQAGQLVNVAQPVAVRVQQGRTRTGTYTPVRVQSGLMKAALRHDRLFKKAQRASRVAGGRQTRQTPPALDRVRDLGFDVPTPDARANTVDPVATPRFTIARA